MDEAWEKEEKNCIRWKIANIIVRVADEKHYTIAFERFGEEAGLEHD